MSRLRPRSKAPLAVAGILSAPLFFAGLLAFALRIDEPSQHLTKAGKVALGNPTKGTVGTIFALAFGLAVGLVLVGLAASLLRSRLATVVPAAAGIVASILLLVPLAGWAVGHATRFPLGTDNIYDGTATKPSPTNLILRGEWEQNAQSTAHQIAWVTIVLAIAAIVLAVALEIRRRRGAPDLLTRPSDLDVELNAGGAPQITGG